MNYDECSNVATAAAATKSADVAIVMVGTSSEKDLVGTSERQMVLSGPSVGEGTACTA